MTLCTDSQVLEDFRDATYRLLRGLVPGFPHQHNPGLVLDDQLSV